MYSISSLYNSVAFCKAELDILLKHVLNFSRAQIIANGDFVLSDSHYTELCDLIHQLKCNTPINYIIGYKEFYSRKFTINKNALIPRPETELLVETIIKEAKRNQTILELGVGSGVIAITLSLERPDLDITATDKYLKALKVAKGNSEYLQANIKFIQSNWFSKVGGTFDIIVSNPPYIEIDSEYLTSLHGEPIVALTDFNNGLSHIKTIIKNAKYYLNTRGKLYIEHGYLQGDKVRALMEKNNFLNIKTYKDYANHERFTVGQLNDFGKIKGKIN